ncbi:iron complex outermembrane receptor protein [Yoonia maricola]|uniref:Iron complex outermembrane receptor protein n=1 Tax=Yoonia maricola TaxID=420999 RepID=A0A2M8W069_9RHOB|nr:TonB-dependent receptor [Yoonia maricola]PJI84316.1 iron complex outermembrane receptor protein [Yoonia maricola]
MTFARLLLGIAPGALCVAGPLAAQEAEEPFALGEIVIEALRTGATESAIPGTVQVIEAEQIEAQAQSGKTLPTIISDLVPGLAPANGTIGGASQTLRGRTTQILIDGIARTSELRGFDRELAMIDPASIARIEVVKGSTARYGNGATGGIINIVTNKADTDTTQTTVSTNLSFQEADSDTFSYGGSFSHERRVGELGLRIELSNEYNGLSFDGSGDRIPADPLLGQGDDQDSTRSAIGFAADWTRGAHEFEFRLDAYAFEQDIDFFSDYDTSPVSVGENPYTGEPVSDEGRTAKLTYRNAEFALGELEVSAFATDIERRSAFTEPSVVNSQYYADGAGSTEQDPDSQSELFTTTYGLDATVRSPADWIGAEATLTWGLDIGRDEVEQQLLDGTDVIAPMVQDSLAAFAQLDVPLGERWEISTGLRAERFWLSVSDFTRPDSVFLSGTTAVALPAVDVIGGDFEYDAVVGNIGAVFHATPTVDLYGGFSQGFSIPDVGAFTRRAAAENPFLAGQTVSYADIGPDAQIVNTWQLGTRYNNAAWRVDVSAYYSTSDEGTVFDSSTNTITQQKERIWGAEATADYKIREDWSLGTNIAFVEGEYDDDQDGSIDSWLPNSRIPSTYTARLYTTKNFDNGLILSGEAVYASGRDKSDYPELDDTTTINASGSYPLGAGRVTLGVTNLFDTYQFNPTASSVRENPDIIVAEEGRRISLDYTVSF